MKGEPQKLRPREWVSPIGTTPTGEALAGGIEITAGSGGGSRPIAVEASRPQDRDDGGFKIGQQVLRGEDWALYSSYEHYSANGKKVNKINNDQVCCWDGCWWRIAFYLFSLRIIWSLNFCVHSSRSGTLPISFSTGQSKYTHNLSMLSVVVLYPLWLAILDNVVRWIPVAAAISLSVIRRPSSNSLSAITSFSRNLIIAVLRQRISSAFQHLILTHHSTNDEYSQQMCLTGTFTQHMMRIEAFCSINTNYAQIWKHW